MTRTISGKRRRKKRGVETLDILLLAGGPGPERDVSLAGGQAVEEALQRLGHRVKVGDVSPDDLSILEIPNDLVFIVLHGEFGEDGRLQQELDRRGLKYTGSGAESSKLAMNKVRTKRRLLRAGLPTPPYEWIRAGRLNGLSGRFPLPAVVKPVSSGSSVDVGIARTGAQLMNLAGEVMNKYGEALVEQYVAGRELTVGILGDQALPVCEIRTDRDFYDYTAKYEVDDTQYLFDVDLPEEWLGRVQELSVAAHEALGCRVLSRLDWLVHEQTMEPFLLEVNTIPGFTSHSLLPKAAERAGIPFDDLCQRIIELSLAGP